MSSRSDTEVKEQRSTVIVPTLRLSFKMQRTINREVCVRDLMTVSIAAISILLAVSAYGDSAATAAQLSSSNPSQVFDPTRGVLLTGAQGQEVAEMCGASPKSKSWEVIPSEIAIVEQQLAPLLAADLIHTGSKALPQQYYRQYATGQLGELHAIFINGFHEDHVSSSTDKSSWQHSAVGVSDGGDEYWCAIYIIELKQFTKHKGSSSGGTYVLFHGVA
jgi:hypothetical protein